jgi:hypothetical protein
VNGAVVTREVRLGGTLASRILSAACAICLVTTLARLPVAWRHGAGLNHSAGVWMGLAMDVAKKGLFYRPLYGPDGIGGTRYFPLHFVLHGALIRLFGHPVLTGFLITTASSIALLAAMFVLLRRFGVEARFATCVTVLLLANVSAQVGITTIRGDLLPAAFSLWGVVLAFTTSRRADRTKLAWAAVCFVLAFSAKPTTVFGAAATAFTLFRGRDRRDAWFLASLTATGYALVLAWMFLGTDGRALASFRSCSLMGARLTDLIHAPIELLTLGAWNDLAVFTVMPVLLLRMHGVRAWLWRDVAFPLFLATSAIMLVVYATPGVWVNHLIDLYVASLVVIAVAVSRGALPYNVACVALTVLASLVTFKVAQDLTSWDAIAQDEDFERALDLAGRSGAPLLAENPLIPILNDEVPVLLDPFALRVIAKAHPDIEAKVRADLAAHRFRAVILTQSDPTTGSGWTRAMHFGEPILQAIADNYTPVATLGTQVNNPTLGTYAPAVVYLPKR